MTEDRQRDRVALARPTRFAYGHGSSVDSNMISGDLSLRPLYEAIEVFAAHYSFPALMTDRVGILLAGNRALGVLLEGVDADLLVPPVNVRRVALYPRGLAPRVLNLAHGARTWSR
jgi:hypothetical protein